MADRPCAYPTCVALARPEEDLCPVHEHGIPREALTAPTGTFALDGENLYQYLNLTRPLIILDTETTGPNPRTDHIVEIGLIHLQADGKVKEWQSYINPGKSIPREATYGNGRDYPGHGITDEIIQSCALCGLSEAAEHPSTVRTGELHLFTPWPTFAKLAPHLLRGFQNCDYAGYNLKHFDLPLLRAEFERAGHKWSYADARILDGFRCWQLGQKRTLSDAVEAFLGRKHEGAHRALDDVKASQAIILSQLARWTKTLPRDLQQLHDLQWPVDPAALDPEGKIIWKDGEAIVNFGKKWRGTPLKLMNRRDLRWIAEEATGINEQARKICADAARGQFPQIRKETT